MPATTTLIAPAGGGTIILDSPALWRLSVSQYHRMIETGILTSEDPVELLEGLLVAKMSKNKPHIFVTRKLRRLLDALLPAGWFADSQEPVTTADSEPEPDVLVLRGTEDDYLTQDAGPAETALVAEVADSTLAQDRGVKKRVYARAGFAVYWIVNLVDRQIEVYTSPHSTGDDADYQSRRDFGETDSVPVMLDGVEVGRIAVRDVLP